MKKYLLFAFSSLLSCQPNPANCTSSAATPCGTGQMCDPVSETCQSLTLTSVSPGSGNQVASTMLTITGIGFIAPMKVEVGGQMVNSESVQVISPTELTALTPVSPKRCGPVDVTITRSDNAAATKTAAFRYTQPGTFTPAVTGALTFIMGGNQIIIDDIDGDKLQDIIVKSSTTVTLCFGDGTGAVSCTAQAQHGLESSFMRLVDYNHDKKQSILVVPLRSTTTQSGFLYHYTQATMPSFPGGQIQLGYNGINDIIPVDRIPAKGAATTITQLWLANDAGIYEFPFGATVNQNNTTTITTPGLYNMQLTRGDTDTAGLQIVGTVAHVGTPPQVGVAVLERDGATFGAKMFTPQPINRLRVADVNGDGKPDVIGATDNGTMFFSSLGQEGGSYSAPVAIPSVNANSASFEVADLTCDGNPGLVVMNSGSLYYLTGHADGSFTDQSLILASGNTAMNGITAFAVKDLNGDGRADIVYTNAGNELKVMLNSVQ